jgi:hypothetical protein
MVFVSQLKNLEFGEPLISRGELLSNLTNHSWGEGQQTNLPSTLEKNKIFIFQDHFLCKNPCKDDLE